MGKSSKLHVDDGSSLLSIKTESLLKLKGSHIVILTCLDYLDYLIDVIKTDFETKEDVSPFLCLLQVKSGASFDYLFPVIDIG